ncbi:glycosyltransferase family 2 protein [Mesorhizobium marinum]|uniref:glycosyltransferase family 2 protein n=1 Tax=Mesorhizobium marinum TaxID=3228790 RepID=UPI0034662EFA
MSASDVVLLCVTKNTACHINSFLDHYRKIGVTRFAFVDDHSNDGTREILLSAADVDTFESNFTFAQCDGGLIWRDILVGLYGRDRWYLSVDSDEYLIYPGCEKRPIGDFISDVERTGLKRALAPMIDLYGDCPLGATEPHFPPNAPPTNFCPLFDGDGYLLTNETQCTAVHGGPRKRVFGADMLLTKFPLLFADEETQFNGSSHHAPLPLQRNFAPVHAVLLHYKFPAGAIDTFHTIVDRQSHARGSHWYRAIVESDRFDETTDLRYVHSQAFAGSEALVANGYMQDLRRPA